MYGSASGITATENQFWNQDSTGIVGLASPGDRFGRVLTAGDFNKDGIGDLAIGIPLSGLPDDNPSDNIFKNGTGSVSVLYGNASSPFLSFTGSQLWTQDSPDIAGTAEGIDGPPFGCPSQGDCFGTAIGAGDFNGDGKTDLAIGVPGEDIALRGFTNSDLDQGMVNVIYGCANNPAAGLCSTGNQSWSQDSSGIEDGSEVGDFSGLQVHGGEHNSDSEDFSAFVN